MGLNLDTLQAFVEFSHSMNFTRAAEALSISQPALHTKIRRLGEELGVPLYGKQGRRLHLTEQGREVVRFARELQQYVDEFVDQLAVPSLTLAAGAGSLLYLLGGAIRAFREEQPTELKLLTADDTGANSSSRRNTFFFSR